MIPDDIQAALDTLRIALMKSEQIEKQTKIKLHRDLADLETKLLTVFLPGEEVEPLNNYRK